MIYRKERLLSRDEEQAIGRRVRAGIVARAESESNRLKPEEVDSDPLIRDGLAARDELIIRNFGLVGRVTKQFKHTGDRDDLFQQGVIGLIQAADHFDPERGIRFSTYAYHWIRLYMLHWVYGQKIVQLPRYLENPKNWPKDDECTPGVREHRRLAAIASREYYYFRNEREEDESYLDGQDRVPEPTDHRPSISDEFESAENLSGLLAVLTPVERHIVIRRYGLDGDPGETLQAIGERTCLCRERIRQLQQIALDKLRRQFFQNCAQPEDVKQSRLFA